MGSPRALGGGLTGKSSVLPSIRRNFEGDLPSLRRCECVLLRKTTESLKNFTDFGLPDLLRGVADLGFSRPTPIQADAIRPPSRASDVLACAMTGSGKTAAFLLPIMQRLLDRPRGTTRR